MILKKKKPQKQNKQKIVRAKQKQIALIVGFDLCMVCCCQRICMVFQTAQPLLQQAVAPAWYNRFPSSSALSCCLI